MLLTECLEFALHQIETIYGACRLVSRNRNAFKTFEPLAQAIALYQELGDSR